MPSSNVLMVYVGRSTSFDAVHPKEVTQALEDGSHVAIFLVGGSSQEALEVIRSFEGRDVYVTFLLEDNLKQSVLEELEYARFWFGVPDNEVVKVVCEKGLCCQEFAVEEAA